ncbi:Intermediate filament protein [Dissophora globulifera]|nr:Intermediate filament protein [Dissophora globulifera]
MNSQAQTRATSLAHAQTQPSSQILPTWFAWPPKITTASSSLKTGAFTVLVLLLSWAFGNSTLRRIASFILATPIVLVLSLFTLAASNVAFSILYTRRQRLTNTSASSAATQQNRSNHSAQTMPGAASRHRFHYIRPARFTRPIAWGNVEKQRRQEQAAKYRTPIADTMPQFSEAIDTVIELIMRDYVAGWMRAITPEVVLQQRIEELLRVVLLRLKARVMDLDLAQLMVTRLVPKITAHVNDFRKAEMALRGNSLERTLTESDELDIMVAGKFRNGKLHRALSTSISTQATEEAYLRNVVQTILPTLLPKSELQSGVLRLLLRELLVGAVLRPVMDLLSDPDYWNQNVDLYIGKAIREQNMVKKLREALKQHTDNMESDPRIIENPLDPYGTGADLYSFEDFLKMIKRCDSLLDVKRIRNTIMTHIRKKKAQIAGREKDDIVNGNKVEDIAIYVNKLETAKKYAERRIEALGGPAYKRRNRDASEPKNLPSFDAILTNPSGLSYFMEFQDRRESMNELQFWLLIDTLNIKADGNQRPETSSIFGTDDRADSKSALGTPNSTFSRTQAQRALEALTPISTNTSTTQGFSSNLSNSIRSSRKASIATVVDNNDTLRDDVRMIYETYFAESAPRPVVVDHSLVDVFREFSLVDNSNSKSVSTTDSEPMTQDDSKAVMVRKRLLMAQQQVFEQMLQKDYLEFVKSDLYFKFLTSHQSSLVESTQEDDPSNQSRTSFSSQRPAPGPALFSAIGLGVSEKRRDMAGDNPKRTSAGSFLDIFGLGRDKDKERDQQSRAHLKPTDTPVSSPRPSLLTSIHGRSKPGSPVSTRTTASTESLSQQFHNQQQQGSKPKQSLEVSSSPSFSAVPVTRTRSLSSISNQEKPSVDSRDGAASPSHKRSSMIATHNRESSANLVDAESPMKSTGGHNGATLGDSLLMELQEHDDEDEDGLLGNSQGGVPIPRMPNNRRGKENVIDAVEAALSSIMESPDIQHEDLSSSGMKEKDTDTAAVDPTDPSFSTARGGQDGADALIEWGKSQKKTSRRRLKEQSLEGGRTIRVKSRDPSDSGRASLDRIFESEKAPAPLSPQQKRTATSEPLFVHAGGEAAKPVRPQSGVDMSDDSDASNTNDKTQDPSSPGNGANDLVQDNVHLAAPGDLLLSDRIKRLEQDIETVRKQEAIVETLIQKAERQGRQNELRILKKSKSALRREILGMEYQKTQYEVQEEENMIMPGRSTISITSSTVGHEGSKVFALYVIEVHQMAQDGSYASGWVIARRYSEFFALHQQLKDKYPLIVRQYELPGKRGFLKLQKSFVEGRRIGLERYLQCLVQHMEICQSQELRGFLSQENVALPQFSSSISAPMPHSFFDSDASKDASAKQPTTVPTSNQFFFEQLFHSATSPLHSPIATRDPSFSQALSKPGGGVVDNAGSIGLDGASGPGQNDGFMKHIYQTVSEGLDDMFSGGPPTVLGNITKQLSNQMMQFTMDMDDEEKLISKSPPEPLCDLFIELFELKEKNNWLRRQAVVIILQQVLGGTIERRLRDTIKAYIEESMLTFYVLKLRDALWPATLAVASPDLSTGYEVVTDDLRLSPTMPRSSNGPVADSTSSSTRKKVVRTTEEKATTKDQANRKLSVFLPELLGNMVGHQNARRGARRMFAAFQNRRLNQQLVYTTLDEVIAAMWPELGLPAASPLLSSSFGATAMSSSSSKTAAATTSTSSATASSTSLSAHPFNTTLSATDASDSGERSASSNKARSRADTRQRP